MWNYLWLLIMVPVSSLFTGLGIYAMKRKKPMWFWSGKEVKEREIADIPAYNKANGITPRTIVKSVHDLIEIGMAAKEATEKRGKQKLTPAARRKLIDKLTAEMKEASRRLEFEQAAFLRDRIRELREGKEE